MLDQLVQGSRALQVGGSRGPMPAACACPGCGARRMITSPGAIRCDRCGVDMAPVPLASEDQQSPAPA